MKSVKDIASEYIKWDNCKETKSQVQSWLNENNMPELEIAFGKRMVFGTAGLRSEMGPGYSRINNLTIQQSTQGLAEYLKLTFPAEIATRGVVIGHDHRANKFANSKDLADITALVFLSKGFKVYYCSKLVHTPLIPFSVNELNALCGVMITASHNPKNDNGYKVYWDNGCQIIPPHDDGIAKAIEENLTPIELDYSNLSRATTCFEQVVEKYNNFLATLVKHKSENEASDLKFCYTAMHGVGYPFATSAFHLTGTKNVFPVVQQVNPDPEFPTVAFPNPEEGAGALKLAMDTADANDCSIILANDPDADRLAVAEKCSKTGKWTILNGNELGTILGHFLFTEGIAQALLTSEIAMVNSTVSSKMLAAIAHAEGFYHEETLTGFKWIGNKVAELESKGYKVLFAYEEAIGYMCGGKRVKDKDGVSALIPVIEMAVQLHKTGLGLKDYLESLYAKYGYFLSHNGYYISHDPTAINTCFERIRFGSSPVRDSNNKYKLEFPQAIGGIPVESVRDLTIGYDSSTTDNAPLLPVSSGSQMITFKFRNHVGEVTLRTSGTEPKVKYYIECNAPSLAETKVILENVTTFVKDTVINYKRYKFGLPPNGL